MVASKSNALTWDLHVWNRGVSECKTSDKKYLGSNWFLGFKEDKLLSVNVEARRVATKEIYIYQWAFWEDTDAARSKKEKR